MIKLKEEFNKMSEKDIQEAQDRDFNFWLFDLQDKLQSLYDDVMVNNVPSNNRKALLDLAYVYIQMISEEAESLLRKTN